MKKAVIYRWVEYVVFLFLFLSLQETWIYWKCLKLFLIRFIGSYFRWSEITPKLSFEKCHQESIYRASPDQQEYTNRFMEEEEGSYYLHRHMTNSRKCDRPVTARNEPFLQIELSNTKLRWISKGCTVRGDRRPASGFTWTIVSFTVSVVAMAPGRCPALTPLVQLCPTAETWPAAPDDCLRPHVCVSSRFPWFLQLLHRRGVPGWARAAGDGAELCFCFWHGGQETNEEVVSYTDLELHQPTGSRDPLLRPPHLHKAPRPRQRAVLRPRALQCHGQHGRLLAFDVMNIFCQCLAVAMWCFYFHESHVVFERF